MKQFIGFQLHGGEYAIPIMKVREIITMPEITTLPDSPGYLQGITNLRDSVIPVVNIKQLMNIPENGTEPQKVIVISCGRMTFGILVDGITGVVSIDEATIESPETMPHGRAEQVEGVAKIGSRLIVLLEPKKLIPLNDRSLLEDGAVVVKQSAFGGTVEITKTVQTMGGEMQIKEIQKTKELIAAKCADADDPRLALFDEMIVFLNAVTAHDYAKADETIQRIIKESQGDLYNEVGKVTRKLHDAVKSFKDSIDPKLSELAKNDMPNAVDRLHFVITKTEEAANKTMSIVEKYIMKMDEVADQIRKVQGPPETISYLKQFKNELEDDLTVILTTQSFQDLTGQTIKKVIALVAELETELVKLIATFGVKIEAGPAPKAPLPEKVNQADVDELLKNFGF
jgi:chemotaxis protein CheZ